MEFKSHWQPFQYRKLWPLFVLITIEALALIALPSSEVDPMMEPPTSFSLFIGVVIFTSGVLPAVVRPRLETLLAGCLAVVMASILVIPLNGAQFPQGLFSSGFQFFSYPFLILRLVNGVCLAPLLFHFASIFPQRGRLSSKLRASVYFLSLGLLVLFLVVPVKGIRIFSLTALLLFTLLLVIGSAWLLLQASWDVSHENQRAAQQSRVLLFSLFIAETPALLRPIGLFLGVEFIDYNVILAFQVIIPLGITYAILRHDLFDIDHAIRRGLVYGSLSLLLLLGYLGLTVGITNAFSDSIPQLKGIATFLGIFVAAVVFDPVRQLLQKNIDRVLFPYRLKFNQEIQYIIEALGDVGSRRQVLELLTRELPMRIGASWATISLAPHPDTPGDVPDQPAWNAPLLVGGKSLGRFWLGKRLSGVSYDKDERDRLNLLVRQGALALAYVETIEKLQEINTHLEALVEERSIQIVDQQKALATYEERQRLARELHDSVNQSLFSLNLSLGVVQRIVQKDPGQAVKELKTLETLAQQTMREMRELLEQLRSHEVEKDENAGHEAKRASQEHEPENLSKLLKNHCELLKGEIGRDGHPPLLDVELDIPHDLIFNRYLCRDVYLLVKEALHNVAKHSNQKRALCRISKGYNQLEVVIKDSGRGFDPSSKEPKGFGLKGMRERVLPWGGDLTISSQPGKGTLIKAIFPLNGRLK